MQNRTTQLIKTIKVKYVAILLFGNLVLRGTSLKSIQFIAHHKGVTNH